MYTGMAVVVLIALAFCVAANAQGDMETITGTVFCNNWFSLYINGELVATDPLPSAPHNSLNVSFRVPRGKDITFAIDARDLANDTTGLELNNRCVGRGGLRAFFSNGVVTNSSWVCSTYLYGPVNWRECYAGQMVRDQRYQLHPFCFMQNTSIEGCFTRSYEKPAGWELPGFDESHWEYAREWPQDYAGWGLPPPGCNNNYTIVSPYLDPNGTNYTCPQNLDWGNAKLIWRNDLDLDNYILCRYTFRSSSSAYTNVIAISHLIFVITFFIILVLY